MTFSLGKALLVDAGVVCAAFHDENVRGLKSKRVQCDEIWAFVGAKNKNATREQKAHGWGDCWTWTALDADSKLLVSFLVGTRGPSNCYDFMKDVASRLNSRVQLTTDGLYWYVDAVDHAFGIDVDYGMIEKHYANAPADKAAAARVAHGRDAGADHRCARREAGSERAARMA